MQVALGEITIDSCSVERTAAFWGELLGATPRRTDDGWYEIGPLSDGGPRINVQPVPEPKTGKSRVHLDIWVDDLDAAIALVERAGGRPLEDVRSFPQARVITMADPDGIEFCLVALTAS